VLRVVAVVAFGLGLAPAAAAAPLSVAAAVEPGSHAATFRWTTSSPATTTVEVGRNDVFGIWLRTPKQPRADGRAFLGSLEPSTTYRYRVTARRGSAVVRSVGTFTTRPFPEWTVGAVVDRTRCTRAIAHHLLAIAGGLRRYRPSLRGRLGTARVVVAAGDHAHVRGSRALFGRGAVLSVGGTPIAGGAVGRR